MINSYLKKTMALHDDYSSSVRSDSFYPVTWSHDLIDSSRLDNSPALDSPGYNRAGILSERFSVNEFLEDDASTS